MSPLFLAADVHIAPGPGGQLSRFWRRERAVHLHGNVFYLQDVDLINSWRSRAGFGSSAGRNNKSTGGADTF